MSNLILSKKLKPLNTQLSHQSGMTLLELAVVLLILVTLATVALRSTTGLQEQARFEQTQNRYDAIKAAIIGDPKLIINGQPDISGFVADMGRLPKNIHELLIREYCIDDHSDEFGSCSAPANEVSQTDIVFTTTLGGFGWNGPYLSTSQNHTGNDAFTDGWGNESISAADQNYGWAFCVGDTPSLPDYVTSTNCYHNSTAAGESQLAFKSLGLDAADGGTGYNGDYPENNTLALIDNNEWQVDISGGTQVTLQSDFSGSCSVTYTGTTCEISGGTWQGFCFTDATLIIPAPSYTNRYNCVLNGNFWSSTGSENCSDVSFIDQATCEAAGEIWSACTGYDSADAKQLCESLDGIWTADTQAICLNIAFRYIDGTGNTIINDEAESSVQTLSRDGQLHTYTFDTFTNSGGGVDKLPIGISSFSVREHDGDCEITNPIYPAASVAQRALIEPKSTFISLNW